ncbi:MAG: 3'(2'),5'-bisphosphate nucleotidase CysQ [Pseudomonadales bacterium]|nr:3'(2'),5'-bisphosphate nucleotidase CysQ [Pseudomonadales bacterium]
MWKENQLDALLRIAISAGKEILSVYNAAGDIDVTIKDDNSPLTEADRRAHNLIEAELQKLTPDIPILSEESDETAVEERRGWSQFWIVDPLDGTKEFIKRNGEFTVNIALVNNGVPELGVVHVPVTGMNYLGQLGTGAWKVDSLGEFQEIATPKFRPGEQAVRVVASRSHRGELVDRLITAMEAELGNTEVVSMGSSLKICLLAEGKADIYPRLAPTSEWDTAAAHAVLAAAGGEIYDTSFESLRYNQKDSLLNPHFIAVADTHYDWRSQLLPSLE